VAEARDPRATRFGQLVRGLLLEAAHGAMAVATEGMLYMASRAQLAAEVIRPALEGGACLLCDRWVSATIAYQGAGGADVEQVRAVARVAVGELAEPDMTLLLDLPADDGLARQADRSPDRMEAKAIAFHRRVRELFLAQAEESPGRFAVVDASPPAERVQEQLQSALEDW
jgi:dTMP kinase